MPETTTRRGFFSSFSADLRGEGSDPYCLSSDPPPLPTLGQHAAQRLQFGALPGDSARIDSIGLSAFLDEQLNPETIDDSACDDRIAQENLVTLTESWAQLFDRRSGQGYSTSVQPFREVRHATWIRQTISKCQLFERVVNFWHDHFNVEGDMFTVRSMFPKYDEDIRTHALGNFRQLLTATAQNPCMQYYLDNYVNTRSGPNENYARELIELHTMGAMNYRPDIKDEVLCTPDNDQDNDGFKDYYIDDDVYEAARCFTGWTFDDDSDSSNRGQFVYNDGDHDHFQKFVLCQQFPTNQAPLKDGLDALEILANHPGTARHICTKLCRRFISDDPPQAIIDSATVLFQQEKDSPDQIKTVLRHIIMSSEFANAPLMKLKRPMEWAVSCMRSLDIVYPIAENFSIEWIYDDMGHRRFEWSTPDGAPDTTPYWTTSGSFLGRWNFIYITASGWYADRGFPLVTEGVTPTNLTTASEITEWWLSKIFDRPVSTSTYQVLLQFLAQGRDPDIPMAVSEVEDRLPYFCALVTMAPDFMWQ